MTTLTILLVSAIIACIIVGVAIVKLDVFKSKDNSLAPQRKREMEFNAVYGSKVRHTL